MTQRERVRDRRREGGKKGGRFRLEMRLPTSVPWRRLGNESVPITLFFCAHFTLCYTSSFSIQNTSSMAAFSFSWRFTALHIRCSATRDTHRWPDVIRTAEHSLNRQEVSLLNGKSIKLSNTTWPINSLNLFFNITARSTFRAEQLFQASVIIHLSFRVSEDLSQEVGIHPPSDLVITFKCCDVWRVTCDVTFILLLNRFPAALMLLANAGRRQSCSAPKIARVSTYHSRWKIIRSSFCKSRIA